MFRFSKNKNKNTSEFIGAQIGATMSNNVANASNGAFVGMDLLRSEAERMINVLPEIKQGNLFEIIERTKFNIDSAGKGLNHRAITTQEIGLPHDPADILIKDGKKILDKVQAKSSNKASSALFEMSNKKYRGMQKLFNSDKVEKAQELAKSRVESGTLKSGDYADTLKNMTGELNYGEVTSGGTSYAEALDAASSYEDYARNFEIEQIKKELGKSMLNTGISTAIIGGGVSIIKNSYNYSSGEISSEEMILNVVKDTSKASIKGATTGAISTGIRTTAQKSGNLILSKSNIATSLAIGTIDVGMTVISYIRGEIDSEQAMIQVGDKGFSTMSSIYGGLAAGVAFGPAGMLVGSIAGYMLASNVYQTCVDMFKSIDLEVAELERLIELYDESIQQMLEERSNLELYFKKRIDRNFQEFSRLTKIVDDGIEGSDLSGCLIGMNELAFYLGGEIKYLEFGEFDEFMKSDETLKF